MLYKCADKLWTKYCIDCKFYDERPHWDYCTSNNWSIFTSDYKKYIQHTNKNGKMIFKNVDNFLKTLQMQCIYVREKPLENKVLKCWKEIIEENKL